MNLAELEQKIVKFAQQVKDAQGLAIPQEVASAAEDFVMDNFQNQSWEGQAWEPSKGTILVKSGALRRGVETVVAHGYVKLINDVPYARVHNDGFDGTVSVPGYEKSTYADVGSGTFTKKGKEKMLKMKTGSIKVNAHSKKMKVKRRQFMPTAESPSPTLNKRIDVIVASEILRLMNSNGLKHE